MSIKKRHSFVAFYPDNWSNGVRTLSRLQRSAYFDLCCFMWEFAKPVPLSAALGLLGDLSDPGLMIHELVDLDKIERLSDGSLFNAKAVEEGRKAYEAWQRQSAKGKAGAGKRWEKSQKNGRGNGAGKETPMENKEQRSDSSDPNGSERARARARPRAPASGLPDWMPLEEWNAYLDMRKAKKAKPTDRAVELLIKKLDGMRAKGIDLRVVLDQSTMNNWTDVFEPKGDRRGGQPKTGVHRRTFDDVDYGPGGKL